MLAILVSVLTVDQISKALVTAWLGPGSGRARFEIWEPVLALQFARNTGAAFGFFAGKAFLLTVFALVIIAALIAVAGRMGGHSRWQTFALGLVAGGASGNVVDRVRLGYVIDFIDVGIWPTFNLADSAITIGIAIAIIVGFHGAPHERRGRAEGQGDSDGMA